MIIYRLGVLPIIKALNNHVEDTDLQRKQKK